MLDFGLPLLFALFIWWFSTGAILYLDGLPKQSYRWTLLIATLILGAAFFGLWKVRNDQTVGGAYIAFLSSLGVWGWNEVTFLTGFITGSRRIACPADYRGLRRFYAATNMILHHEIVIAAVGLGVFLASDGGRNHVGLSTYCILWIMRLSTKFNLFLGVPNAPVNFLPHHLRYMASGFRIRRMNPLFPVSVTLGTMSALWLASCALAEGASDYDCTAFSVLAMLMALAIMEHWFLMTPLQTENLWRWGMRSHLSTKQKQNAGESEKSKTGMKLHSFAEIRN